MNTLRTRLAAAAIGVGLAVAAPAAAWAGPRRPVSSTPTTASSAPTDPSNPSDPSNPTNPTNRGTRDLETIRAKCLAAIDVRLPALAGARADAVGSQHLTDDHRAALTTNIDGTTARLRTLADEIKADTDLATLRDHCRSIFGDNRVFALVLPRTRLVVGADTATAAGATLHDVAGKLADAIAKEEAAGRDTSQARADLDAMKAQIASAMAAAGTVPGAVLGLTPADWNANHDALQPARQSLRVARADLKVARDLAVKIRHELVTPAQP
jgi:hypothetical protein